MTKAKAMRDTPNHNVGGNSGSRASHRANSSVVSTKGFDPGRAWPLIGLICFEIGVIVGILLQWRNG